MGTLQRLLRHTDLLVGMGLIAVMAMLVLPLPVWLLDTALVLALGSSILILLTTVSIKDPLEFSVFPSLLLVTTLYRLALSVAATKLILGTAQGGRVIETFGAFVMGGDFVVGFIAFLILVIVQFVVITNGAGRVSEVVARFTLDAMPGKQMAIDADLAAGVIDEEQARARRARIKQEADFYGAMDGASKFVRGDAIAALLIIAVNIVGGFAMGFMRGESDALSILKTYALLSVGEGLVAQIPALLISTSAGLMVTRAGQDRTMGRAVAGQVLSQPKAIGIAGLAMLGMALVPGFPATIFLAAAAGCGLVYRALHKSPEVAKSLLKSEQEESSQPKAQPSTPESVLPLAHVDPLEIEIGYGLTSLADPRAGGDLPDRVAATRRQLAVELGFVMPTVRIRDSVLLEPNEYVIKVRGEEVARAACLPNAWLAVGGKAPLGGLAGAPTKEPVFGSDALWIDASLRDAAQAKGYTVISPSAVISTHLSEIAKAHAPELLSRQDVQALLDAAKQTNKAVVEELVPNILQVGDVQKVLQHLLRERVPIRDMVTILETMADYGARIKDPDQLGELARSAISRTITRQYLGQDKKLRCLTIEPSFERALVEQISATNYGSTLAIDPSTANSLVEQIDREQGAGAGRNAVVLCCTQLRLPLRRLVERRRPDVQVLAYNEVAQTADVELVGQIKAA